MKTSKFYISILFIFTLLLFISISTVSYSSGPNEDWACIVFYGDIEDYYIYYDGDINNSALEGVTYDLETNTLTLSNLKTSNRLIVEEMGDDFKINLIGDNEVAYVDCRSDYDFGCNLHFTGYGSLTANKDRNSSRAIVVFNGKIIVDDSVTLKLYVPESIEGWDNYNPSALYLRNSAENDEGSIILKNGDKLTIDNNRMYEDVLEEVKGLGFLENVNEHPTKYQIFEKNEEKYAMYRFGDGSYRIKAGHVKYEEVNGETFIDFSTVEHDEAYNTLEELEAAGYTDTGEEFSTDKFLIYPYDKSKGGKFKLVKDKDNVEHAVYYYTYYSYKLSYAYDFTDKKITLDNGETYTILKRNKTIDLDDLTDVTRREYWDEYEHRVSSATLIILPTNYEVIEGANETYTLGGNGLSFRIAADYSNFENGGKVFIDGNETKKFSSKSGSTIIEFNDEYLNTLSEGEHTIRVAFNNGGYAQTEFTIKEQEETATPSNENTTPQEIITPSNENTTPQEIATPSNENTTSQETVTPSNENEDDITTNNPKTGDNITLWISLMVISMLGVAGTVKIVKKNK